jgi:hypothetical protein
MAQQSEDRIDWSQLWYPGPTRVFSAEEMARAGGDRPSRSFMLVLAVNIAMLGFAVLLVVPPALSPLLLGLLLLFTAIGWPGCMALWRQPTRRRLNLLVLGGMAFYMLSVLGLRLFIADQGQRETLFLYAGLLAGLLALGLWFVAVFRAQQIAARLRELEEFEQRQALQGQLLQAQIQPHFLFNSLASLQHWVEVGDQRAAPLLRSLTGYLRATLPLFNRSRLSLGEELAAAREYLAVMQARLGERLAVRIEIEPGLEQQALPPALLLTLVENAIEHGVVPKLGAATLTLRAARGRAAAAGGAGRWPGPAGRPGRAAGRPRRTRGRPGQCTPAPAAGLRRARQPDAA